MKRTDVATLIFVASLSVIIAYFVANAVIGGASSESVKVKAVEPISADIEQPDPSIFNRDAINPTVEVVIGGQGS